MTNQLHYGDNLDVLRDRVPSECADLIYLDPPFNSARNYNLLFKQVKGAESPAQIMAFEDTWTWSPSLYAAFKNDQRNAPLWGIVSALYDTLGPTEMMAYLVMMAPRLIELRRVLKPTGSLYLHCDSAASHYLKLLLDVVIGAVNFRNEIIWKRTSSHSDATRKFPDVSDTILFYNKIASFAYFDPQFVAYSDRHVGEKFGSVDSEGRQFTTSDLRSPSPRPNLTYNYTASNGNTYAPHPNGWAVSREVMERYDAEGRLYFPKKGESGKLRLIRYLDETKGKVVGSVWDDIPPINARAVERRGYPTQKPLALLDRIISASCPPGGTVLDPFCGCGTAVVQAERMGRKWIGIDITYLAINEVMSRLQEEKREGHPLEYDLVGTPKDADAAQALFEQTAAQNHKPFEQWAVSLVPGARYNEKKGADRGIDGRLTLWVGAKPKDALVQVKGGNGLTLSNVRDFAHVIEANDAPLGFMVSQKEPTKEMRLVAENMGEISFGGTGKYPRYQLLTVRELLEEGTRPIIPDGLLTVSGGGVGKYVNPDQSGLDFGG